MTEEKIARINALAKKSKTTGLTEAEKAEQQALRQEIYLPTQQAVQDLFQMTPYYYKTGAADQRKLEQVSSLRVTTEFEIAVYAKK